METSPPISIPPIINDDEKLALKDKLSFGIDENTRIGITCIPGLPKNVLVIDSLENVDIAEAISKINESEHGILVLDSKKFIEEKERAAKNLNKLLDKEISISKKSNCFLFDSRNNEPFYAKFYNKRNKRRRFN